jgi:hypothetical protein
MSLEGLPQSDTIGNNLEIWFCFCIEKKGLTVDKNMNIKLYYYETAIEITLLALCFVGKRETVRTSYVHFRCKILTIMMSTVHGIG